MARRASEFVVDFEVVYVDMPEGHIEAWRAGVSLLLQLLDDEEDFLEANDGIVDADRVGDDGGVGIALLPVEALVEG